MSKFSKLDLVKKNSDLDFLKNNTSWVTASEGIIFDKIKGRDNFNYYISHTPDRLRMHTTRGAAEARTSSCIICNHSLSLPPANKVWGKVVFSQVSVCPQGEGGWLPSMQHRSHDRGVFPPSLDADPPRCRPPAPGCRPSWMQTPWMQTPPPTHGILWDTVNKRTVRILPECILVDL